MTYEKLGGGVRQRAQLAGLDRYFTGKACPRGHVCDRRVGDYCCVECYGDSGYRLAAGLLENGGRHRQHAERTVRERWYRTATVFTPETLGTIREMLAVGRSTAEIAEAVGSTDSSVMSRCYQLGIMPKVHGLREQAKSEGLARYFTGRPCAHGHMVDRRVCDGKCVECQRLKKVRWRNEAKADLTCGICGSSLAEIRYATRYCSEKCRRRAQHREAYARKKEKARLLGGWRFVLTPNAYSRWLKRKKKPLPVPPKFCSECGVLFVGHTGRALTCSKECGRERQKRRGFFQSEEARERARASARERDRQDRILLAGAKRLLKGELV